MNRLTRIASEIESNFKEDYVEAQNSQVLRNSLINSVEEVLDLINNLPREFDFALIENFVHSLNNLLSSVKKKDLNGSVRLWDLIGINLQQIYYQLLRVQHDPGFFQFIRTLLFKILTILQNIQDFQDLNEGINPYQDPNKNNRAHADLLHLNPYE